MFLCKQI